LLARLQKETTLSPTAIAARAHLEISIGANTNLHQWMQARVSVNPTQSHLIMNEPFYELTPFPPMIQFDATATPMFDCFTSAPDFSPFMAVANRVPLDDMNPSPKQIKDAQSRRDAVVSARLPLDAEDQCPEDVFNHMKGVMKGVRP
jgi:hypothetical protein